MKYLLAGSLFCVSIFVSGQNLNIPGINFYQSKLADTISLSYYPTLSIDQKDSISGFIIHKNSFNSSYPFCYNDGPVWKGKGVTSETHLGAFLQKGNFSLMIAPVLYFSQNGAFELNPINTTGSNSYGYKLTDAIGAGQIDWVQQFGDQSFFAIHPGQTSLQFAFKQFHTSISTQNFTLGPAVFNPILMSNQGPGFPHLTIGAKPTHLTFKDKPILKAEGTLIYGVLKESKYFNKNPDDNFRVFNTIELGISPVILFPNLKIGFQKAMYQSANQFDMTDFIAPIKVPENDKFADSTINDLYDQMASISMEWAFPSMGFRAYVEFAKNDFTGKGRWTKLEPEHSRAYTLGFEKSTQISSSYTLNMIYEHTNLSINHSYLWRAEPSFYSHPINIQGYTNLGQLLGAGIGPGGTSDQVNFLLSSPKREIGAYIQRVENNKDYLIRVAKSVDLHDILFAEGIYYLERFNKFNLIVGSTFNQNYNRYNILFNDQNNFYCSAAIQVILNKN